MTRTEGRRAARHAGFSLLEMMVAISIMALCLGALYQAASGATRNVRAAERYAYAVELARSLLAENAMVPQNGVNTSGETGSGFQWVVQTSPRDLQRTGLGDAALQDIEVSVAWYDGSKRRHVALNSVVEAVPGEAH